MLNEGEFSVAVVGCGVSGIMLALALLERNISVQIYEQGKDLNTLGAGLGFSDLAIQAMKWGSHASFEACMASVPPEVATNDESKDEEERFFLFADGRKNGDREVLAKFAWVGGAGVYRAQFVEEMAKRLPDGIMNFRKRLRSVNQEDDGCTLEFEDGTTASASTVIGCDGIKSRVRQILVGENNPAAHPHYTHIYSYRGLAPGEEMRQIFGEEWASSLTLWSGDGGSVAIYPVSQGRKFNISAYRKDANEWNGPFALKSPKSEMLADFTDMDPMVVESLKLLPDMVDVWPIFDLVDFPLSAYHKDRICVIGDAAHAIGPFHGAGAGMCAEDAAVLSEFLEAVAQQAERKTVRQWLQSGLAAFTAARIERTRWLMESTRYLGDLYSSPFDEKRTKQNEMKQEVTWRWQKAQAVRIQDLIRDARETFNRQVGVEHFKELPN